VHDAVSQPNPSLSLFERIGGQPAIQNLLHHFYSDVRQHGLLGPVFARHIPDWPAHLKKIGTFWAQITGGPSGYHGGMPARHLALGIEARHFQAWLQLWEFNCQAHLPPAEAGEMISLSHEIGRRLRSILRISSEKSVSAADVRGAGSGTV
jgi:hemoglobin